MWETFEQILTQDISQFGLLAVFVTMMLESTCIPIPSEIVVPYAGFLVAKGQFGFWTAVLTASLANLTGSWIAYFIGRFGGRRFLERYGKYIFISRKHLAMADRWFDRRGELTVFLTRMMPAVRTFISLPAGIAGMDWKKFSLYTFLGALPWNAALVYLGMSMGKNWDKLQAYLHEYNLVIYIGIALVILGFIFIKFKKRPWKNHMF